MPLKRSRAADDEGDTGPFGGLSGARGNAGHYLSSAGSIASMSSPSSSLSIPETSSSTPSTDVSHDFSQRSAQKKRRSSSFDLENLEPCAPAPSTARPHALPRTARERFVPGLQTFVGGLQMSQSVASTSVSGNEASTSAVATRRSLSPSDAIPPLVMSRHSDADRRTSLTPRPRRRSQAEPIEHASTRAVSPNHEPEAPLVPGVSPGWHVEASGRQAMELQEGVRHQDEDGWSPLDAFPALTPQGRLVAHRARLRLQAQHDSPRRQKPPALSYSDVNVPPVLASQSEPGSAPSPERTADTNTSVACDTLMSSSTSSCQPLPAIRIELNDEVSCSENVDIDDVGESSASGPRFEVIVDPKHDHVDASGPSIGLSELQQHVANQVGHGMTPKSTYELSDFEVLDTLGTGTFGRVLLVRPKGSNIADRSSYFALKVLAKDDVVRLKQVSHINSERKILHKVEHPFLVNMKTTFQDSKNCYMLMEYVVGGEIFSYLRRAGHFSADVARFYLSTIVLAIEYLHERNIIYRDLKPENLLIDEHGYTKITDFGFAKEVEDRTWTLCGTPEYLAPEIIQCSGHGKAVDWWSLGILLFEMLAGYPPFYDPKPFNVYEKILQGNLIFPDHIDAVSRDLITSLLTADRSRRLGNLRGGAQDVKNHPWFHGVDWRALEQGRIRPPIVPYLGAPGDTSNFSKYHAARHSALPGLFGLEPPFNDITGFSTDDPHRDLFPNF